MKFTPISVKRLRKRLKMTQVEFALAVGVSERSVIHWEQGTRGVSPLAQRAIEAVARGGQG